MGVNRCNQMQTNVIRCKQKNFRETDDDFAKHHTHEK